MANRDEPETADLVAWIERGVVPVGDDVLGADLSTLAGLSFRCSV